MEPLNKPGPRGVKPPLRKRPNAFLRLFGAKNYNPSEAKRKILEDLATEISKMGSGSPEELKKVKKAVDAKKQHLTLEEKAYIKQQAELTYVRKRLDKVTIPKRDIYSKERDRVIRSLSKEEKIMFKDKMKDEAEFYRRSTRAIMVIIGRESTTPDILQICLRDPHPDVRALAQMKLNKMHGAMKTKYVAEEKKYSDRVIAVQREKVADLTLSKFPKGQNKSTEYNSYVRLLNEIGSKVKYILYAESLAKYRTTLPINLQEHGDIERVAGVITIKNLGGVDSEYRSITLVHENGWQAKGGALKGSLTIGRLEGWDVKINDAIDRLHTTLDQRAEIARQVFITGPLTKLSFFKEGARVVQVPGSENYFELIKTIEGTGRVTVAFDINHKRIENAYVTIKIGGKETVVTMESIKRGVALSIADNTLEKYSAKLTPYLEKLAKVTGDSVAQRKDVRKLIGGAARPQDLWKSQTLKGKDVILNVELSKILGRVEYIARDVSITPASNEFPNRIALPGSLEKKMKEVTSIDERINAFGDEFRELEKEVVVAREKYERSKKGLEERRIGISKDLGTTYDGLEKLPRASDNVDLMKKAGELNRLLAKSTVGISPDPEVLYAIKDELDGYEQRALDIKAAASGTAGSVKQNMRVRGDLVASLSGSGASNFAGKLKALSNVNVHPITKEGNIIDGEQWEFVNVEGYEGVKFTLCIVSGKYKSVTASKGKISVRVVSQIVKNALKDKVLRMTEQRPVTKEAAAAAIGAI